MAIWFRYHFGEVIAFDTTYKGNMYGRPLMSIVGVNHHHRTIVFGFAILADETTDTFEWVFTEFLQAMCNTAPVSVMTDGDRAMHRDIKTVFLLSRHRICLWHLPRNAQANIGDPKFTTAFTRCLSSWWIIEEFDRNWRSILQQFNIEHHPWVVEKDQTLSMWAQAYVTGHFFANVRSTQLCEAMNAALSLVLQCKKTYLEVVCAIHNGINEMRITELREDFKSSHSKPFPTKKLNELEENAADIFTHASFEIVETKLKYETLYRALHLIVEVEGSRTYRLTKYKDLSKLYEAVLDLTMQNLTCSCRKFETLGLPCCHQLYVLKLEDISEIPKSLILTRWTKNAKHSAPSFAQFDVPPEMKQMARFASL